jgi:hypothetical protein
MTKRAGVIAATFVLAVITALNGAATAQITADQQSAIRASCRSDFQSKCSGVTPGGTEALACLQKNVARLSPACKTAVSATLPEPVQAAPAAGAAPATAKPKPARAAIPETPPTVAVAPLKPRRFIMPERRILIEGICHSDARALCAGTLPIGSKMIECLAEHASSLSRQCYDAIARISH